MKPVPPSQRSAAPHGRLTSFLAALLMTMHVTGAPLLGADTGDFKVGEVVEYRIGDTAPFMMKITRIDAGASMPNLSIPGSPSGSTARQRRCAGLKQCRPPRRSPPARA